MTTPNCLRPGTSVSHASVGPSDVAGIVIIGFVASVLVSTQDITTDGHAAKYLPEADRGIGDAIQGGSVAAGAVIGGTMGPVLYRHFGWDAMLLTIAAVSLLPLLAALSMHEPPGRPGDAPRPSLRAVLRRPEARTILWIALVYRAGEGLVKAMEGPYLVDAGVPLHVIGYISGLSAATVGLGGSAAVPVRRAGVSSTLSLLGGMRTLCFLLLALHATGTLVGLWPLFGAAGFQTLIRDMEIVALCSLFMAVSSSDQPGDGLRRALLRPAHPLPLGSLTSGRIADALGYPVLFGISATLSGIAVVATVGLLRTRDRTARG